MGDILLVRHGQAQTGATDEASYDRLSDLGWTQARWLGDHLRDTDQSFDHVISGTLRRQRETADGLAMGGERREDARLNEIDYFSLADEMLRRHDVPIPTSAPAFAAHVPPTFEAWQAGELTSAPEAFHEFEGRVRAALSDLAAMQGRVLVVTSSGVIAMAMRVLLDLGLVPMTRMLLATRNTSVHGVARQDGRLHLANFGAVPHLDRPDRRHALTYA